nr:putative steroid-binding protein 3 [Quercus suber]
MSFAPKVKVDLDPPKDDIISLDYLSKCDGKSTDYPTYVAIKGTVFDVSGNSAYNPGGSYQVFAGKDASRALAQSSLKAEECRPEWEDLSDDHKKVLNDWYTFFSKRYNIKGKSKLRVALHNDHSTPPHPSTPHLAAQPCLLHVLVHNCLDARVAGLIGADPLTLDSPRRTALMVGIVACKVTVLDQAAACVATLEVNDFVLFGASAAFCGLGTQPDVPGT